MAGTTDRNPTRIAGGLPREEADEVIEQVTSIARRLLDGHYGEAFAKEIAVRREESLADDEHDTFLDITIAFDAEDPEECDPGWLATFLTELRASLLEAGIEEFPVPSYLFESNLEQTRETIGSVQAR